MNICVIFQPGGDIWGVLRTWGHVRTFISNRRTAMCTVDVNAKQPQQQWEKQLF